MSSESEEEYEVEAIVDYRSEDSDGNEVRQVEVKWKGFDSDENTWQDESGLTDDLVKDKIRRFKKRRKQSQEVRYITDDQQQPASYRKRSREQLQSSDDDDFQPRNHQHQLNDDRNHNYEKKQKSKKPKISKRERLAEELRNRTSKGNNAYGVSGVKSRAEEDQKYREKLAAKQKRERMNSKMPALLGKQLPSTKIEQKKKRRNIDREKNKTMDRLIKTNNPLGSPLTTMKMPSSKIKSKKKDSYEQLKNNFNNKKKITSEIASTTIDAIEEGADILDGF